MSGSAGNLPVRITVEGGQQAEAAFNSIAATGERAMQRVAQGTTRATASSGQFRNAIQQGGFQLQDFAVQVQGGTSALTALSQQGSQFLGVFGPAGAVAGAVLTVGLLAASFLGLGRDAETGGAAATTAMRETQTSAEQLATAIQTVNDLFLSQGERAANAANAVRALTREQLLSQQDRAVQLMEGTRLDAAQSEQRLADLQRQLERERETNERVRRGGGMAPVDRQQALEREIFGERARLQGLGAFQGDQDRALGRINEALGRLSNAGRVGSEQFGPDAPASGPAGSAGSSRGGRPGLDVRASVAQTVDEATAAYDRYNQSLNLSDAGLSNAASAVAAYEASMTTLNNALAAGVITEQQFAQNVETSSVALAEQMDALDRRAVQTDRTMMQFGMTFNSALEGAITRGEKASDVMRGLGEDIAKLILRITIMEPLARSTQALFSGGGKGGGGSFLSSIASTVGGWLGGGSSAPIAGAKANGGPVAGGSTYLVGERGPELFTPAVSGGITPNHAMGGVTFAPSYTIDARGSDASILPRVEAIARATAAQSLAQFADSIRRGGAAAKLVGR